MLLPDDQPLVAADRSLPGLRTVLDPEALRDALMSVSPVPLESLAPVYIRYKLGTSCLVQYEAETAGGLARLYARTHRPHDNGKLEKALVRAAVPDPLGIGIRVISDAPPIIVYGFPNDHELKTVPRWLTPNRLNRLARRTREGVRKSSRAVLTPLRYKAERRFVGRLDVEDASLATLKIYSGGAFDQAATANDVMLARAGCATPQLLRRRKRERLMVFEWIPGVPLGDLWARDSASAIAATEKAGAVIARIHSAAGAASLPSTGSIAIESDDIAQTILELMPEAHRVVDSATAMIRGAAAETDGPPTAIHGDFSADQVICRLNGEVAILDFDRAAMGDPMRDCGSFIARLLVHQAQRPGSDIEIERIRDGLLRGYGSILDFDPAALRAFVSLELLRLAVEPFRRRHPQWRDEARVIINLAQACLRHDHAGV